MSDVRVLVVDDSKTTRRMLRTMLEPLGFEVVEAEDGSKAIARLEEGFDFALALLDWDMPGLSGLELLSTIRRRPQWRSLPVVMVTSHADRAHLSEALTHGADEYLMKPFTRDVLVEKLEMLGIDLQAADPPAGDA